jgi:uncharacterized protein (TIGR02246 family)
MTRTVCFALLPLILMAQTKSDDAAIRAVMDRFMDAWNRHDAHAFASVFTADADFTNVRGQGASGRKELEEFHEPMFATVFKDSHQEYAEIKTRYIRPDVAAVDVSWKMTGVTDPTGNPRPPRHGLLNFVMTKSENQWLIVVMHNLDLSSPTPTSR